MKDRFNNAVRPQVRSRKARPGCVIPVPAALSLGGGLQGATQSFAGHLQYQAVLGPHINRTYPPWAPFSGPPMVQPLYAQCPRQ